MQTETKSIFLLLCLCPPSAFAYIYPHGNTNWGDQLTSYNGTAITYDGIGNPLSYYNGSVFSQIKTAIPPKNTPDGVPSGVISFNIFFACFSLSDRICLAKQAIGKPYNNRKII